MGRLEVSDTLQYEAHPALNLKTMIYIIIWAVCFVILYYLLRKEQRKAEGEKYNWGSVFVITICSAITPVGIIAYIQMLDIPEIKPPKFL